MNPSRIAYFGITSPKIIVNSAGEGNNYKKALESYPPKEGKRKKKKIRGFNHPKQKLTG